MQIKNEKIVVVVWLAAFCFLMLIFTFSDLSIAKAMFNPNSMFGKFFEQFGQLPFSFVGCFCSAVMICTIKKGNVLKNIFLVIGSLIVLLFSAVVGGFLLMGYAQLTIAPFIAAMVLVAVFVTLAIFSVKMLSYMDLKRAAKVGVLLVVISMVVIEIIKPIWGRQRFRSMDDPDIQFTRWFMIQSIGSGDIYKSFPSGHAAQSATIMWITLLPTLIPQFRTKIMPLILNIIAYTWIALAMISRIIMGAHFATDVTFGAGIVIGGFYLLRYLFYRKPRRSRNQEVEESIHG